MKTIIIRGPLTSESGYGIHSQQIANWLIKNHTNANIICSLVGWGNTPWKLKDINGDVLLDEIHTRCVPITQRPDVSFQIQLPNEWDPALANYNVGITAAIETDRCNPQWIDACNRMSAIVVPSQHAAKSITNVGVVHTPIHIIPEAFFDEILVDQQNDNEISNRVFSTNFNFLIVGQLTAMNVLDDRKNIYNTIRWICEEFKDNTDVGIIIKTNAGRNTKIDKNHVISILQRLSMEIGKSTFPKIHLIHGSLTNNEMKSLYTHKQVKALVTLTRGEGYGLPIIEAAACGLPIIATNWSAHTEFLKHGKFISINYVLEQIHQSKFDDNLFMPGAQWAAASEDDFKKKIKKFYNSSQLPKQWAQDLSLIIKEKYNQVAINQQYETLFGDIL